MNELLQGRSAIVTGSTSGIGLGIATRLVQAGANVMLNGFGAPEAIEEIRTRLAAYGSRIGYHGADVVKPAEIEALVAAAMHEFGAVDVLVNNAGVQYVAPLQEFPGEQWE